MGAERRWLVLLAFLWAVPVTAQELKPFVPGSYGGIVEARAGTPFLLVFWSIDCPPCYSELRMLGELRRSWPFDLVLVSTDRLGAQAEAGQVLARFGLADADAWLFAAPPERLRFEVDRTWYGELPRSYLFGPEGREAVTGAIEEERVRRWLATAP